MRTVHLLVMTLLFHAGCEGCDFSYGPIEVVVTVTPEDVPAEVTLCAHEVCETHTTGEDTGVATNSALFWVGWQGYAVCKVPDLVITVTAEGCAEETLTQDAGVPSKTSTAFDVALDCG